jgi:hypothetical protein
MNTVQIAPRLTNTLRLEIMVLAGNQPTFYKSKLQD